LAGCRTSLLPSRGSFLRDCPCPRRTATNRRCESAIHRSSSLSEQDAELPTALHPARACAVSPRARGAMGRTAIHATHVQAHTNANTSRIPAPIPMVLELREYISQTKSVRDSRHRLPYYAQPFEPSPCPHGSPPFHRLLTPQRPAHQPRRGAHSRRAPPRRCPSPWPPPRTWSRQPSPPPPSWWPAGWPSRRSGSRSPAPSPGSRTRRRCRSRSGRRPARRPCGYRWGSCCSSWFCS
jgi:hypothetical protein